MIDPQTLGAVSRRSRSELADLRMKESRLLSSSEGQSTVLFPGSASYGHFRNSRTFNEADLDEVMDVSSKALEMAIATRVYKDRSLLHHNFDVLLL